MPPGSMARHMVGSPAPVSSAALRSLKTVIATRPMRTSLGRRWGNRVNEGLTAKRLQVEDLNALVAAGRKLHPSTLTRHGHSRSTAARASNGQPNARLSLVKILHL
jgi:hypothetical protein